MPRSGFSTSFHQVSSNHLSIELFHGNMYLINRVEHCQQPYLLWCVFSRRYLTLLRSIDLIA